MGGGGTIIIRSAVKTTLSDPMVHGSLPNWAQVRIDPVLQKDVGDWSDEEHQLALWCFNWAGLNC